MSTKIRTAAVFQFRPRDESGPETVLPMPATAAPRPIAEEARPPALDLSGQPKVWFLIGRGRIGKTMLARWAADIVEAKDGQVICAAADPVNRSLRLYRSEVAEPPSSDPADVAEWLQELLLFTIREKTSALVDLGGGSTALDRLLADMPDLAEVMQAEGVAPVAMHVIGSDPHDLVPLAAMEAAGFKPRATAIVCNLLTGRPDRFAAVLRHSAVGAALARGAERIWMPALTPDAARMVDAKRLQFTKVGNALGPFAGASVRQWLAGMEAAFQRIASWLP